MIVSINQPAYLPWLGYFDRIASSDIHIILDHVQFEKNSMVNRNKVRVSQGWAWLTVPVSTKGKFGNLGIQNLEIAKNSNWQKKHWSTIRESYSKSPHFNEHLEYFEDIYHKPWDKLAPLINDITSYLLDTLSINTKIIRSSELDSNMSKSDLILELCRKVGATSYLSGALGREYLNTDEFSEHGISVVFQDYKHLVYRQIQVEFIPNMSVIDLLFNEGQRSLEILSGASN